MSGIKVRRLRLSGTGRAGLIGTVTFVVTGAADLLLTVFVQQAWAPPTASIVILVPGLFLAYRAIPGPSRLPGKRRAAAWDPVDLGVHQVAGGGPLPPYIRRPHDDMLDTLLDPDVTGSRLVVVRGGSSTGKTRALYEAVAKGRLSRWRLEYPRNAAALETLMEAKIPARTVLWLGELHQYTNGDDVKAAGLGRLARLLETQDHVIAVTTMWPEHWDSYREAARTQDDRGRDPEGTAGRMLARFTGDDPARLDPARGGVIDVPAAFTAGEITAAARAGQLLADAADAAARAGQDGQIAQYLAGVPDLLTQYQGPGGDRYGQAVITAAMDAARLGFESPLPEALLLDAVPGYLTDLERTRATASWARPALEWAAAKLQGAVQAVQPVPPPRGTGIIGYRPADYLDQHGRHARRHEHGPSELWDALTTHATSVADLIRLAKAAEGYEMPGRASGFRTRAADQLGLDNPWEVARLLRELRESGSNDATAALARRAAPTVSLDSPWVVFTVLRALLEARASDAVQILLDRNPAAHVSLDDPLDISDLLKQLGAAGAGGAVDTLGMRAVTSPSPYSPPGFRLILRALREAGASHTVISELGMRAVAHARIDNASDVASLLHDLRRVGAGDAETALLDRNPAAHVNLDNDLGVISLLLVLHAAEVRTQLAVLARRVAAQVSLDSPGGTGTLSRMLRVVGEGAAADELARRAADAGAGNE
jgi:hypothetical protein